MPQSMTIQEAKEFLWYDFNEVKTREESLLQFVMIG